MTSIKKIAIIGGGNLGTSIAKGILSLNNADKSNLIICEKRKQRVKQLMDMGFEVVEENITKTIQGADIIIVSVKPQHFTAVLTELKSQLRKDQLVVSTVTGVPLQTMRDNLGEQPIVRIMPNTAIEIRESMTCICSMNTSKEQDETVIGFFDQLGKTIVLQEELLDAVTVLGACGIAFALRFIRAATQGGIEIGFSAEVSQFIASQTVKGAARLLHENASHPESEIDKVTTPQGITISGLNEMEHQGFSSSVIKGLLTSYNKLVQPK
ncbi:MAG: pyrroline-5-carboxylate reductase [Bacteroidales bacterium]|nr:pyrroline-5-carboxylate reductase [Bacteroidales bacterium]